MYSNNMKFLAFTSAFVFGVITLTGYQNCAKVKFRDHDNSGKTSQCTSGECPQSHLTIQLFNGYGDINNPETEIAWNPDDYVSLCSYIDPRLNRPDQSPAHEAYFVLSVDHDTNNVLCSRGPNEDPSAWQCEERRALQGGNLPPEPPQESNWVELETNRKYVLSYTGIPFGDYKLRFKANAHADAPEEAWQEVKFRVENCNTEMQCDAGFYNTEELCETSNPGKRCDQTIQCVREPCYCTWSVVSDACSPGLYESQEECEQANPGRTCVDMLEAPSNVVCRWSVGNNICPAGYYTSQLECEQATGGSCIEEFVCVKAPCCGWKSGTSK